MKILTYENLIRIWITIKKRFATKEEMDELNTSLSQYVSQMNEIKQNLQSIPSNITTLQNYVEESLESFCIKNLSFDEERNELVLIKNDNTRYSIPLKEDV